MKKQIVYFLLAGCLCAAVPAWAQEDIGNPAQSLYEQGLYQFYTVGNYKEAVRLYEEALEIEPEHEGVIQELAARYNDDSQFEKAERLSLRGVGIYPENAQMYLNLGIAYAMQGMIPDAMGAYESAIYLDPESVVALANFGAMHYEMGNNFESRQALSRAKTVIDEMPADEKEAYAALLEQINGYLKKLETDAFLAEIK